MQVAEKLAQYGPSHLQDGELISLLTGANIQYADARELFTQTVGSLQSNGLTKLQASKLIAALELGKRAQRPKELPQIKNSEDCANILRSYFVGLQVEQFHILALNRGNKVIAHRVVSEGGTAGTIVDNRVIFRMALDLGACALVLAHNHPSNTLKPSQSDLDITRKAVAAGKVLDVQVIDHIIMPVQGNEWYSFADNMLLG